MRFDLKEYHHASPRARRAIQISCLRKTKRRSTVKPNRTVDKSRVRSPRSMEEIPQIFDTRRMSLTMDTKLGKRPPATAQPGSRSYQNSPSMFLTQIGSRNEFPEDGKTLQTLTMNSGGVRTTAGSPIAHYRTASDTRPPRTAAPGTRRKSGKYTMFCRPLRGEYCALRDSIVTPKGSGFDSHSHVRPQLTFDFS